MTTLKLVEGRYRIDDQTGCWIWQGPFGSGGYGHTDRDPVLGRHLLAHRASYEVHVGPVPDGFELDHLCRIRRCINPAHLEAVTHRENVLRGASFAAVNASKTHCAHGHPFDGLNTYIAPDGRRQCRACNRAAVAAYKARRAA